MNQTLDNTNHKKKKLLSEIFDSFFIMIICFATLLTAMLLKGNVMNEAVYRVDWLTLGILVLSLIIYLSFILHQSDKELRKIMSERYKDQQ